MTYREGSKKYIGQILREGGESEVRWIGGKANESDRFGIRKHMVNVS